MDGGALFLSKGFRMREREREMVIVLMIHLLQE
jgi:hypothetical protein